MREVVGDEAVPTGFRVRTDRLLRSTRAGRRHVVTLRVGQGQLNVATDGLEPRRYGRRAFLGLVAGGLSSLAWAGPAAQALSPVTSRVLAARSATSSRSAAGGSTRSPARCRSSTSAAGGSRSAGSSQRRAAHLRRAARAAAGAPGLDFHCVTGWTVHDVHWSGVRFQRSARRWSSRCPRRRRSGSSRWRSPTTTRSRSSRLHLPT